MGLLIWGINSTICGHCIISDRAQWKSEYMRLYIIGYTNNPNSILSLGQDTTSLGKIPRTCSHAKCSGNGSMRKSLDCFENGCFDMIIPLKVIEMFCPFFFKHTLLECWIHMPRCNDALLYCLITGMLIIMPLYSL
jgi:hypothetical protein